MSTGRAVLGICGAPGAGKSTLAARLASRIGDAAVVVPDGRVPPARRRARPARPQRSERVAPETFDVAGYVALLGRMRAETGPHGLRAGVRPQHGSSRSPARSPYVPSTGWSSRRATTCCTTQPGWSEVRPLLDEVWFVESDEGTRVERLVERHVAHGKPPDLARRWTLSSDQANADLVARTRGTCRPRGARSTELRPRARCPERGPDHRQLERQPAESHRLELPVVRSAARRRPS